MSSPFAAELTAFRADVDARLAKMTPKDTIKGIFLTAYLQAYKTEGGPALYEQCLALLGEKRGLVDFFSYPYANVLKIGVLGAEQLGPRLGGITPYLRAMGRVAVDGYLKSALGQTFMNLVQPTPKSMLSTLPVAIRTMLSFGERTFTMSSPSACVFACRNDYSPAEANAGAIEAVIVAAKATEVKVSVTRHGLLDYDIVASWKP
jgi:uncharacterized protein (TIGR02265 family)